MTQAVIPREIEVRRLATYARAETSFFHWSGKLLVAHGQYITADVTAALLEAGIERVYTAPVRRVRPEHLESIDVLAIPEGARLQFTVYDGEGNLLAREGQRLTRAQMDTLSRRKHRKVYYFRSDKGGQPAAFQSLLVRRVRDRLDDEIAYDRNRLKPRSSGIPLGRTARVFSGRPRPKVVLSAFERYYRAAAAELETMWGALKRGEYLRSQTLMPFVNELLERFLAERELLEALAAAPLNVSADAEHGLGTAVYSLSMALRLGYNRAQAKDLIVAALFHDVGYMAIPRRLLQAERSLSRTEREVLFRHIEHGLFFAQRLDWPNDDFLFAIYQHHERGTGAGYPTGYGAEKIHEYASVLAAADVFHALISDRPHRKALLPTEALKMLMKMAAIGLLDKSIGKALVDELSLYPVGAFVILSTGETARVIGASAYHERPWAGTVFDRNGEKEKEPRVLDLSKLPGISIRGEVAPVGEPLAGF